MTEDRGIALGTLVEALLAEAREAAPTVELSADWGPGDEPCPEVEPIRSVTQALLRLGLTFQPCSAKLFVRPARGAAPQVLELYVNDVAREAPVALSEWRLVEES